MGMKRHFRNSHLRWDEAMRSILGTRQVVREVNAAGSMIGLDEAEADSGKKVWHYPRECVVKVMEKAGEKKATEEPAGKADAAPAAAKAEKKEEKKEKKDKQ